MQATTLAESAAVWPAIERLAEQAAAARADLLVLPETTYPAYWLESATRYMRPEILRSAEVLKRFSAVARQRGFYLVAGFVEEREGKLFNSAAMFDRGGDLVGIARKNFLWDCDNRWFSPGDSLVTVDTEFGRVGMLICADCRAPEITATLVADGARMLILPTAWVNAAKGSGVFRNVHPEFLIRARAIEFGVPFVCASKTGREGQYLEYVGQSRIVSAEGKTLADAPIAGECLIFAEVQPTEGRLIDFESEDRQRILSKEPPHAAEKPGHRVSVDVNQPVDGIQRDLEAGGARVESLPPNALLSFAPARRDALEGAQVIIVHGHVADEGFARARAAENRVFVWAANATTQFVVRPDGSFAYRDGERVHRIELDLAQADLKQFTPETDIWAQRRVSCYRLPAPAAVTT